MAKFKLKNGSTITTIEDKEKLIGIDDSCQIVHKEFGIFQGVFIPLTPIGGNPCFWEPYSMAPYLTIFSFPNHKDAEGVIKELVRHFDYKEDEMWIEKFDQDLYLKLLFGAPFVYQEYLH